VPKAAPPEAKESHRALDSNAVDLVLTQDSLCLNRIFLPQVRRRRAAQKVITLALIEKKILRARKSRKLGEQPPGDCSPPHGCSQAAEKFAAVPQVLWPLRPCPINGSESVFGQNSSSATYTFLSESLGDGLFIGRVRSAGAWIPRGKVGSEAATDSMDELIAAQHLQPPRSTTTSSSHQTELRPLTASAMLVQYTLHAMDETAVAAEDVSCHEGLQVDAFGNTASSQQVKAVRGHCHSSNSIGTLGIHVLHEELKRSGSGSTEELRGDGVEATPNAASPSSRILPPRVPRRQGCAVAGEMLAAAAAPPVRAPRRQSFAGTAGIPMTMTAAAAARRSPTSKLRRRSSVRGTADNMLSADIERLLHSESNPLQSRVERSSLDKDKSTDLLPSEVDGHVKADQGVHEVKEHKLQFIPHLSAVRMS
jgi:hypothetical protein